VTTYLFAGGGTAGHVNPLLATADRLREREPDAEILVLGTAEGLEARLGPNRSALDFPSKWRSSVARVRDIISTRHVDVVVGFGGYASAPAYRAAQLDRLPLVLHEQNAKPGIANRFGARLTSFVGVTFASTSLAHGTVVGLPLRREIEQLDPVAARAEGRALFGLDARMPTLLVTGGSTGAKRVNDSVATSVAALLGSGWQVLHITGSRSPVADPGLAGYHLLEYCDRMDLALAVTDLAVSRAGAGTLAELAALGVPAILVPYAAGNGEQAYNARDAVHAGSAIVVTDDSFTPEYVETRLPGLLRDRARIADMAARMAAIGVRDAADRMVDLVLAAQQSVPPRGRVA
jgi:UDP-N-acetylglucosamine--N-acetylmuramyl-(pentapeptide) pyrophosphoryl-undecaprenol N-acetylglucosamine transferase